MDQPGWDNYYLHNQNPWTKVDPGLVAAVENLEPGKGLDLGCGEGADSLWLAARGWEVTAIDFSPAAITTVRRIAADRGLSLRAWAADILEFTPEPEFDLVIACFIHLPEPERKIMLARATSALAPGGTLLYIGIVRPADPAELDIPSAWLALPAEIGAELAGFKCETVQRGRRSVRGPTGNFSAEVTTLRARRRVSSSGAT